jgi:hypothetical protein
MKLVVQTGPLAGREFPLNKPVVAVGRGVGNDIMISDAQISRRHAEIRQAGGGFVVADVGSTNGTLVNNQRITVPQQLRPGDVIQVGQTRLVFQPVPVAAPAAYGPAAYAPAAYAPAPVAAPQAAPNYWPAVLAGLLVIVGIIAVVVLVAWLPTITGPVTPAAPVPTNPPIIITTTPPPVPTATTAPPPTQKPVVVTATPLPPTATPSPLPTVRTCSAPPVPAEPADGASQGGDITLRWSWADSLGPNELFDVWVWPEGEPPHSAATTGTSSYVFRPPKPGVYGWMIGVVSKPADPSKAPIVICLPNRDQQRRFIAK